MPHIELTPAKYAAQLAARLPEAAHYERAMARMDALHADMDADPREMEEAEQQAAYARLELDAATPWDFAEEVPFADTPEDITTRTIPLDDGTAVIEHVGERVEMTVKLGDRLACALILSPAEAEQIGLALARPHGPTVADLHRLADSFDVNASDMIRGGR